MAIEKMVLLNMTFHQHDLDEVLLTLKNTRNFYPQPASKIVKDDKYKVVEDETYTKFVERLSHIADELNLDLNNDLVPDIHFNETKEDTFLNQLEQEMEQIRMVKNQLAIEKQENEITLKMLEHLSSSEVDLDQLQTSRYLKIRFGRVKKANLTYLKYEDQPVLLKKLGEDQEYMWCCYIVTCNSMLKVDNIFKALGFEDVKLPNFVHGTIDKAKEELHSEIEAMKEYLLRIEQKTTVLKEKHKVDLMKLYSTVLFLQRIEAYKVFVMNYQNKYAIYGFIPQAAIEEFKQSFQYIHVKFKELPSDALELQDINAPVLIDNKKWIQPFEMLNGVENSTSVDTTIAYAILYYVVFMVLLGDLGVGAILGLLGLLMKKKKLGQLYLSLGIATLLGGLMYGTVFYTVNLYPAITLPISLTYKLLDALMFIGVGTLTMRYFLKMKTYRSLLDKLFSFQGVSILICLYAMMIYVICNYEIHMHLSIVPFEMIVIGCLILVLVRAFTSKKVTN